MPVRNRHATSAKVRESPRDLRVLRWLKRKPIPAVVSGETNDGEEVRVKILVKAGERPNWADAARALHDCSTLVALDSDGDTVRTLEHDEENDPELRAESQREEAPPTAYGSALLAIDVPRLVEKISESMANVSRTAAEQQSQAHAEAFKQMGNVLSVAMNLLSRLEAHIADLESAEPAQPAQESPSEGRDQMAMQLLSQLSAPKGSNGGLSIDLPALLRQIPPEQLSELVGMLGKGES